MSNNRDLVSNHREVVELAYDTWGDGPPVMVLHGFTGSAGAMIDLTRRLSGFRIIAVDLIGHGRSPCPDNPDHYTMEAMVEQVLAAAETAGHSSLHLVGYSMGGRVALSAACQAPRRLRSLTLIGASPGISCPGERRRRADQDEARAKRIEADLAGFVDEWMASDLFVGQQALGAEHLAAARSQRLSCDPAGLARSLRIGGTAAMPPLHDLLGSCEVPAHVMVGADDHKFSAMADQLGSALGNATVTKLASAGHSAHLEQADATATAIAEFIAAVAGHSSPGRRDGRG